MLGLLAFWTEPLFIPYGKNIWESACVCVCSLNEWVKPNAHHISATVRTVLTPCVDVCVWVWTHIFPSVCLYACQTLACSAQSLSELQSSALSASVWGPTHPLPSRCCFALDHLWPPWVQLRKSSLSLEGKPNLECQKSGHVGMFYLMLVLLKSEAI